MATPSASMNTALAKRVLLPWVQAECVRLSELARTKGMTVANEAQARQYTGAAAPPNSKEIRWVKCPRKQDKNALQGQEVAVLLHHSRPPVQYRWLDMLALRQQSVSTHACIHITLSPAPWGSCILPTPMGQLEPLKL